MMRMMTLMEAIEVKRQSSYWNIQGKSLKSEAVTGCKIDKQIKLKQESIKLIFSIAFV